MRQMVLRRPLGNTQRFCIFLRAHRAGPRIATHTSLIRARKMRSAQDSSGIFTRAKHHKAAGGHNQRAHPECLNPRPPVEGRKSKVQVLIDCSSILYCRKREVSVAMPLEILMAL